MSTLKCASCSLEKNRGKLLKCMHNVCVPCLPNQITFGSALIGPTRGETTCPSPARLNQFQALVTPNCDDCVAHEKAVSICVEWKMNFCYDHATSHPKSRATDNHKLEKLRANWLSCQICFTG